MLMIPPQTLRFASPSLEITITSPGLRQVNRLHRHQVVARPGLDRHGRPDDLPARECHRVDLGAHRELAPLDVRDVGGANWASCATSSADGRVNDFFSLKPGLSGTVETAIAGAPIASC